MAICKFGLWIKKELLNKEMTQRQLAERTQINEKVVSDIIHGRNVKTEHIDKIQKVLGSEA
ncbi:MAG: helix-turn-helix transcriptional regulator [Lachnospiraceae bacterium]|nr:helix-turn-helix transcriptional regulator [Lachnospiraceae bacterium]